MRKGVMTVPMQIQRNTWPTHSDFQKRECRHKCLLGNAVSNKQSQLKGLVIWATIKKTIELGLHQPFKSASGDSVLEYHTWKLGVLPCWVSFLLWSNSFLWPEFSLCLFQDCSWYVCDSCLSRAHPSDHQCHSLSSNTEILEVSWLLWVEWMCILRQPWNLERWRLNIPSLLLPKAQRVDFRSVTMRECEAWGEILKSLEVSLSMGTSPSPSLLSLAFWQWKNTISHYVFPQPREEN